MKNITVIPSFTGSPIHKKSWSLGINQGRAIYCFTLPLSTWTASCVVDSDYQPHHHCSYDFLSVHMMFFIDPNCHRVEFHPTHISQQSHLRSLSILDCNREETDLLHIPWWSHRWCRAFPMLARLARHGMLSLVAKPQPPFQSADSL